MTSRKLQLTGIACLAMLTPLGVWGDAERIGSYTWYYKIDDQGHGPQAVIYNGDEVAISPEPSGSLTIPDTLGDYPVVGIGMEAFAECSRLTSVVIPEGVEWIAEEAFEGCTALRNVELPEGLVSIGNDAFCECPIAEITLPASLTEIDTPFVGCAKLMNINVASGSRSFSSIDGILFSVDGQELILYPNGRSGSYAVPTSVTGIANWAFLDCENLSGVAIYAGVKSIGEGAFAYCPKLSALSVADDNPYFKTIGGILFDSDMTTLKCFPAGLKGLSAYTVPASVTALDAGAFLGCGFLTSVILPHGIMDIPEDAFSDCQKLGEIVLGAYVETIGVCAFEESPLKALTIPYNVRSIGHDAFNCDDGPLKTAYVPEGCEIGEDAFSKENGYVNVIFYSIPGNAKAYINMVRFDTNDGEAFPYDRQVFGGNAVGTLPVPYREKYQFLGWFTAPSGGTKATASTKVTGGDVTYYAQWLYDGSAMLSVSVAAGQEAMGKVSGGGTVVKAGTKVALKATANSGCVFAGWHANGEPLLGAMDYRTASYSYVTTGEAAEIEARFASVEDDIASLGIALEDSYKTFEDGSFALDLGTLVSSISIPKMTVAGLPNGLKFDTKTLSISGKASKPGTYQVKVKLTNASVKKAVIKEFALVVPNISCTALPNLQPWTDAYRFEAGMAFDPNWVNCTAISTDWKVSAAGLPTGLKFDANTGTISGVATKPGVYTVTFTAKAGKETQMATITLNVLTLPAETVGTFNGFAIKGNAHEFNKAGTVQLTTTDTGKITAKAVMVNGTFSFSATGWSYSNDSGHVAEMETKKGERLSVRIVSSGNDGAWFVDQAQGVLTLADGSRYEISAQKAAFGQPWYFKAEGTAVDGWTLSPVADAKSADITITESNGATKLVGEIGGYKVSSSGYVNMGRYKKGIMSASFTPVVAAGKGRKVLVVDAELNFDHGASEGRAGFGE